MTIFLTTQYLEEADELADRVGIINEGKLVAEGTPFELKRRIGNDVIFARLDGDAASACPMVEAVAGVAGVEARGNEMVITAAEGTAVIGPVAVALNGCGVPVRDLTLRTPTLDDVFLELTGTHIQPSDEAIEAELAEMTGNASETAETVETAEVKP
jgi:ABC-2 type transport system ATP-binding protein